MTESGMRSTQRSHTGPARFQQAPQEQRRSDLVPAIGSAVLLMLLVVGVPAALLWLAGVPQVPTSLPTRAQLTATIGFEQVLTLLVWVVWLAWLQFTVCVLVEARSALSGVGLPARVPLAGPSQRMARTLVASVLLLVTAAGPATALTQVGSMTGPQAGVSVSATVEDQHADEGIGPAGEDSTAEDHAEPAPTGDVTYRLGDMELTAEEGAQLVGQKVYVVQPPEGRYHDNLWDIAERELGEGRRYQEIFELNKGREQPDGRELSLARLIQPNWLLVMPDDAVNAIRVEAVEAPQAEAPAGHEAPAGSASTTEGAQVVPDQVGAADEGAAATPDGVLDGASGLLGAGLLAAGLLGVLESVRRRRRTPEPSPAAVEAEVALRVGADPARAMRLEAALRGLAAVHEAARRPLPGVYGARVDDEQVELLLSPPRGDAPEPWGAVDGGRRWVRAHGAQDEVTRRGGAAAYPGLVSLGRDDDGGDVLIDLEAAQGPVAVVGDVVARREVVNALAAELATNAWSGPITVHGADLPDALEHLGDRYVVATRVEEVLARWRDREGQLDTDVLTGRVLSGRPATWAGEYLALGSLPEESVASELTRVTSQARTPWGVVCAGDLPGARWRLAVDSVGRMTVDALGITVQANRLRAQVVEAVAELVAPRVLAEPAADSSGAVLDRPDVPLPPRPVTPADLEAAPVAVRVLGAPQVSAPGVLPAERVPLATELVVHLALHPEGVHPAVLAGDLWPHGVTTEVRSATIRRAQEWLGTDSRGAPRLRERPDGRLCLAEEVCLDWDVVLTLLRRSRDTAGGRQEREDLSAALDLASGAVLADRPERRYAWLARVRLERASTELLVDAAHRLAILHLADPDPGGAARAARAGLAVAPGNELLWRDALRAAGLSGGPDDVRAVAAELEVELHRAGVPGMSSETTALIEELAPGAGVHAPTRAGA